MSWEREEHVLDFSMKFDISGMNISGVNYPAVFYRVVLEKSVTGIKGEYDNISGYYRKQFPRNFCIMDILCRITA